MRTILTTTLVLASLQHTILAQDFMTDAKALRLSFTHIAEESLEGRPTAVGMNQWEAMAPAFYIKPGNWTFAGGVRYQYTNLDFSDPTYIDDDSLHSMEIPVFLSYETSDALKWMAVINPNLSGDYEDVGDSWYFSALAGAMYSQNERLKWLFGAYYSNGFDDDFLVPAVGFHWNINDRSDLLVGGPFIRYSNNLTKQLDLLLSGRFASNRWNTTGNYSGPEEKRDLRIRAYRVSAALQWNISKGQAAFVSIGADLARELEIQDSSNSTLLKQDLETAPVIEIGFRYRF
jgi:hypothetical protein